MTAQGSTLQEIARLFRLGHSKSEIARKIGRTKKEVEKMLPAALRLLNNKARESE